MIAGTETEAPKIHLSKPHRIKQVSKTHQIYSKPIPPSYTLHSAPCSINQPIPLQTSLCLPRSSTPTLALCRGGRKLISLKDTDVTLAGDGAGASHRCRNMHHHLSHRHLSGSGRVTDKDAENHSHVDGLRIYFETLETGADVTA